MKRTKGKLSEWQSGTIAPKFEGVYPRQDKAAPTVFESRWDGKYWWVISDNERRYSRVPSIYQISNGHEWQWRGIIEEE